jgi:hypothetical protein
LLKKLFPCKNQGVTKIIVILPCSHETIGHV